MVPWDTQNTDFSRFGGLWGCSIFSGNRHHNISNRCSVLQWDWVDSTTVSCLFVWLYASTATRPAKCTVLVIQHHCGQIFGTHLDGCEGRCPVRRGCGTQPRKFFWWFFVDFEKNLGLQKQNSWKCKISKNCLLRDLRPNILRPSRREVKNDVWKYFQNIVICLYAGCGHLLDNQNRAHSQLAFQRI